MRIKVTIHSATLLSATLKISFDQSYAAKKNHDWFPSVAEEEE
jgi:hypothetical protein